MWSAVFDTSITPFGAFPSCNEVLLTCGGFMPGQGFVRLAAETGAHIVPVISFGENDLFTAEPVKPDTPFGKFQR